MNTKNVLESKTLWVNVLSLVVTILGLVPENPYALEALAIANIILRMLTTEGLTILPKK